MTPSEWQRLQRAIAAAVVARAMQVWERVDPKAIGLSWGELIPVAAAALVAGQEAAAAQAARYVNDTIAAQVDGPADTVNVNPFAFAGVASDGRPLETLLTIPGSTAGIAARAGASSSQALHAGRTSLAAITSTQVYDAGRLATGVGITAHSQAGGYRRQLRGTRNCARCVILAGKWYRWNQGFQRHPRCDCVHVPSVGPKSDYAGVEGFDPKAYFESLSEAEQDRAFTKAGAQAIRDGADMNQVVNARRGMKTTRMYGRKVRTTTEGTTVRASFGRTAQGELNREAGVRFGQATSARYRRTSTIRLMPEEIYAQASDREHAIELLRINGFI